MSTTCWAQTQGNLPTILDAYNSSGNAPGTAFNSFAMPENIAVGDLLVGCVSQQSTVNPPPYSMSDSLGNTWTATTATVNAANTVALQMFYTVATFAGADTVTSTLTFGQENTMNVARFTHVSGTLDGSAVNGSSSVATGLVTAATSNTTTANGDLLVSCASGSTGTSTIVTPQSSLQYATTAGGGSPIASIGFANCGLAGTCAAGFYGYGGNASQQVFMQTLAFKPPTGITVVDTALPDCAASTACSMQLHAVGGSGAYTWACTGLPSNGLSLNTATGVISASTPTASTLSLGCTATDGSLTSATKTLSLKTGAAFSGTPAIFQSASFNGDNGSGSVTLSGAQCGHVILVCRRGADTHGTTGYVHMVNGTSNFVHDTLGSAVQRLYGIGGTFQAPLECDLLGPLTTSGADQVIIQNSTAASSGLPPAFAIEVNAQAVVDAGTFANLTSATSGSVAQSLTTVVPNELVIPVTGTDTSADTFTMNAPFSLITQGTSAFNSGMFGSDSVAAASTVTATTNITTICGASPRACDWTTVLVPLRPALPVATCSSFVGAGEKIRRQVF